MLNIVDEVTTTQEYSTTAEKVITSVSDTAVMRPTDTPNTPAPSNVVTDASPDVVFVNMFFMIL